MLIECLGLIWTSIYIQIQNSPLRSCANKKAGFAKMQNRLINDSLCNDSTFFQIANKPLKRQFIAGRTETGDLSYCHRCNKAVMAKLLTAVYV